MSAERFFDDLARTLAASVPRRRALRLAAGVLVGVAVPGISASSARASTSRIGAPGQITCKPTERRCACPSTIAGLEAVTCCPTNVPYVSYKCQCFSGANARAQCTQFRTCPEERSHCGACCPPGQVCNTLLEKCECKKLCGGVCCKANQTCKQGKCCPNPRACGSTCCPANTKCAFSKGKRTCCPSSRTVTQTDKKGRTYRFCCPEGTDRVRSDFPRDSQGCCPPGNRKCCTASKPPDDPDLAELQILGHFCVHGKDMKL